MTARSDRSRSMKLLTSVSRAFGTVAYTAAIICLAVLAMWRFPIPGI
ncbi:hypothetical protein [Rhodococcoides yunnanense]|nr:hypothetical protein [Rhodococcus yunnanensis]